MIQAQNLTKTYGPRLAIDRLSFEARKGEIVGFLGPNGAGKTTTMRILTGYMPPTSGVARIAGYDVVEESLEVRKRVGYMPETVPLYKDMSVLDYLIYMGRLRRVPDVEDRAWEVLERVGMEDRAESFIGSLSKGMRQRVGLAQAIIHQPDVLILDEPTIGLDPTQVVEVRRLIQEIGQEHTVLLSTHILAEAQQLCDRVLIINQGRIVAEDTPANLQLRLQGGTRILVALQEPPRETLLQRLQSLEGVRLVETVGERRLEIIAEEGQEIRPWVARTVLETGHNLLEMRQAEMSLEEIFLQLIRDETAEDEGEAEEADTNAPESATSPETSSPAPAESPEEEA
ncbi:MAG: ABC transporter ATP-binding protein [Chloroflexi bacterium]|nr:ABC transporter ATP-binding protein [Chloroflexota bacterium]